MRPSMGSVGDAYDNALCESFFATLECELLDPPALQDAGGGPDGGLRLHRRLLQPAKEAFGARLPVANQL